MRPDRDRVTSLLKECSACVHVAGRPNGTAFFVAPDLLLTCAHVVASERDWTTYPNLTVNFREDATETQSPATAVLARTPAECDLALLTLTQPPSKHAYACLSTEISAGDSVTSYGYPENLQGGGGIATFNFEGEGTKGRAPLLTLKDGQADSGASGSAVLNDRLRTVAGVLTWSRNLSSNLGGRVTPINLALEEWPQLRQWQSSAGRDSPKWHSLLPLSLWRAAEAEQRERLHRTELHRRDLATTHPLRAHWHDFLSKRAWHERLEERLKTFEEELIQATPEGRKMPEFPRVDFQANYDHILAGLLPFIDDKLPGWLRQTIIELTQQRRALWQRANDARGSLQRQDEEEKARRLSDRIGLLVEARKSRDILADALRRPHFDRCFLVLGNVGSGKTHFLTSVLATTLAPADERAWILWLSPHQFSGDIDTCLLAAIRERTQVEWASLGEFEAYLQAVAEPRMWAVAVDDLQNVPDLHLFLPRLYEFISARTQLHRLHWVFALDHVAYMRVSSGADLWHSYGYVSAANDFQETLPTLPRGGRIGAWMELDELNAIEETGRHLIERVVREAGADPQALLGDLSRATPQIRRQLMTPFVAWVVLDVRDQLGGLPLVDLHHLSFIDLFWKSLLPRLDADESVRKRLETCVGLLTTFLLNKGELHPAAEALKMYLVEESRGKFDLGQGAHAEMALEGLARSGLLRPMMPADPDPEAPVQLEFLFEAFWHWRLGGRAKRELDRARSTGKDLDRFLNQWFGEQRKHPDLASGMLQFLLLWLEEKASRSDETPWREQVWRWAAESAHAPREATWFAASKVSAMTQQAVARMLLPSIQSRSVRGPELFSLVYFFASVAPHLTDDISLRELLNTLQPHYESLRLASLGDYFLYTVRRGFDALDSCRAVVESMVPLDGCEILDLGHPVAQLSLEALEAHEQDPGALIDALMSFLAQLPERAPNKRPDDRSGRYRYRTWMMTLFCRRLLELVGLDAFELLSKRNWYAAAKAGITPGVGHGMAKEANFAFADWYRAQRPKPRRVYCKLVSDLANSPVIAEREAALFMVRHTQATYEQEAVPVDAIFHPMLRQLAQDPELQSFVSEHREFLQANHISIP